MWDTINILSTKQNGIKEDESSMKDWLRISKVLFITTMLDD
jgi:hypothetical protein